MSRRYDDPVNVRRRDEDPCEFLWRGRLYVIRAVLAHWVETGAWWSTAKISSGSSSGGSSDTASGGDGAPRPAESSTLVLDGAEREVWRVEASRGRSFGTGVYDVSFNWAAGGWTLLRALD